MTADVSDEIRPHTRSSGSGRDLQCNAEPNLPYAIVRELVADLRLDCVCRCDVGIATDGVAILELGKSASIERARQLWLESQRRAIIVDGRVELAHFQVDQPTRVIRCGL